MSRRRSRRYTVGKNATFLFIHKSPCLGKKELRQMEVNIESTRKSFKYLPSIHGAPLCSHLKYAIFDHFSLIFAHCDNIFDKKLLNLPFFSKGRFPDHLVVGKFRISRKKFFAHFPDLLKF